MFIIIYQQEPVSSYPGRSEAREPQHVCDGWAGGRCIVVSGRYATYLLHLRRICPLLWHVKNVCCSSSRYEPRCSGLLGRGWSLPKLQPNSCVRVVHLFCTHSPTAAASSHSSFCDSRRDGGHVPHGSPFDYSSACLEAMGQIHSDSGPNQPERTEGNESKFSYMHNIPPGEGTVQGTICADK